MKLVKFTNLLVLGVLLTVGAAGCKHKPQGVTPLPGQHGNAALTDDKGNPLGSGEGAGGIKSTEGGIPANDPNARKDWPRDRSALQAYTVHFDYDSSVVKSGEKSKVSAVADFLKNNAQDAVEIEGHCDERGTEEYNRALGERRASALRDELVSLGVSPTRIDTISFGRDRPVDTGHSDEAHRKNRRGEFVVEVHPK